jgi:hypothetical protein
VGGTLISAAFHGMEDAVGAFCLPHLLLQTASRRVFFFFFFLVHSTAFARGGSHVAAATAPAGGCYTGSTYAAVSIPASV